MRLGSAQAVANRFAHHSIHPTPQVGALTPPIYSKGWPSAMPPLPLPSCRTLLPQLTSYPEWHLWHGGGLLVTEVRGHTPTGPPGHVFQRPDVLDTSLGESGPPSPPPSLRSQLLTPVSFAHCWAIWAPLSGSLGGGWLSSPAMLGGPPLSHPPPPLGHRHLQPVPAALCTPAQWRRELGGEKFLGTQVPLRPSNVPCPTPR